MTAPDHDAARWGATPPGCEATSTAEPAANQLLTTPKLAADDLRDRIAIVLAYPELVDAVMAVVQPVLDAKDAQIARLTRELTSLAQATHDLDQKAIDAYEERDAAQQRAEDAEAETARLTRELAQARADLGRYDHYATQIGAKEPDTR